MIKVLFICHGNICRSPMAEFIMKKKVADLGLEDEFYIASAATSTEEIWNGIGSPVYPPAREQIEKHGLNCDGKRAILLKKSDYDAYDHLLCMDRYNVRNTERITGHKGGKIRLLLSFTGKEAEISDPWYDHRFANAYREIEIGCDALLTYLQRNRKI